MANEISLTWDQGELAKWRGQGLERAMGRALLKAGRDALRAMKTASQRSVRFRKRIKVARVNASLPLTFPRSKDIADLEWRMDVSGQPIPVIDYPHSETQRGVTVAINAGRRVLIKSAFEATMRSGHVGIFLRTTRNRLPIREAFTTKVSDVFNDAGMIPAVQAVTLKAFSKTFDRVFPLEVDKAMK